MSPGSAFTAKNHSPRRSGKNSDTSCVCLNAHSIVSKRFVLSAYIFANKFDVVAITEIFTDNSIHNNHVAPPGYTMFCKDRSRHGGGLLPINLILSSTRSR